LHPAPGVHPGCGTVIGAVVGTEKLQYAGIPEKLVGPGDQAGEKLGKIVQGDIGIGSCPLAFRALASLARILSIALFT